jgi:hypothetical protein
MDKARWPGELAGARGTRQAGAEAQHCAGARRAVLTGGAPPTEVGGFHRKEAEPATVGDSA